MSIKHDVESFLPNCDVIINNIIERKDRIRAQKTCDQVGSLIKSAKAKFLVLGNSIINVKQLEKQGLHLNPHENVMLTANLLNSVRS